MSCWSCFPCFSDKKKSNKRDQFLDDFDDDLEFESLLRNEYIEDFQYDEDNPELASNDHIHQITALVQQQVKLEESFEEQNKQREQDLALEEEYPKPKMNGIKSQIQETPISKEPSKQEQEPPTQKDLEWQDFTDSQNTDSGQIMQDLDGDEDEKDFDNFLQALKNQNS